MANVNRAMQHFMASYNMASQGRERREARKLGEQQAQQQTDLLWLKSVLNHGKIEEGKFDEIIGAYRNVYPASDAMVNLFKTQYGSAIDKTNKLMKLDQRALKEIEMNGKLSGETEAEYIQIFDGVKGAYEHTSTLYKFEGMDEAAAAEEKKATAEAKEAEAKARRATSLAPGGKLFAAELRKEERLGESADALAKQREAQVVNKKRTDAYAAINSAYPVASGFNYNPENSNKQLKAKKWIDYYLAAYPEWDAGTLANAAMEMVSKELEGETPDPTREVNADPKVQEMLNQAEKILNQ